MSEYFDPVVARIKAEMKLSIAAQAVYNQNIANANNPSYVAKDFDRILQRAVERQKSQVVLEDELQALGVNAAQYTTLTRLMNFKMNVARTIATQGRR